jgi:hypothetical protein
MKGLVLRHLRWWMDQPILDAEGILTIGYCYPNLKMAESYNGPGSPAWAMKAFLPLALADDHPFWTADEEPLPSIPEVVTQKHPFMVLCRESDRYHVFALAGGQFPAWEPTFKAAKYAKFAYSTAFGFSVPAGEWGLEQGAFDSCLALAEDDNYYRPRRNCEEVRVEDACHYSRWKPWHDVEIETWLIPMVPWHLRIHRIGGHLGLAEPLLGIQDCILLDSLLEGGYICEKLLRSGSLETVIGKLEREIITYLARLLIREVIDTPCQHGRRRQIENSACF